MLPRYIRAKSAAKLACVSMSTFWKHVAEGRLPRGHKLGGVRLFETCAVIAAIKGEER
jgi:predicted DNA-binding transcriptional regulator AlpA